MVNEFHNTRIGQKFLEWTVPELNNQLHKLNANLEKLIELNIPEKTVGEINKQIKEHIPQFYSDFGDGHEDIDLAHTCIECGETKPDDLRVSSGMKCGQCAYG